MNKVLGTSIIIIATACLPGISTAANIAEGYMSIEFGGYGFFLTGPTAEATNHNQVDFLGDGFAVFGAKFEPGKDLASHNYIYGSGSIFYSGSGLHDINDLENGPVHVGTEINQNMSIGFVSATDSDGKALSDFSVKNLPAFMTLDPATGTLTGTPTTQDIGCYPNIQYSSFNGIETVTKIPFVITVHQPPEVDVVYDRHFIQLPPPSIFGSPETKVAPGTAYSFTQVASGCSVIFNIKNKPPWANFNSENGTLSGTPTESDKGVYSDIQISATDYARNSEVNLIADEVKQDVLGDAGINVEYLPASLPSFSIVVDGVNNPPSYTPGTDVVVCENAGSQEIKNWATGITDNNFDIQQLKFIVENDNPSLFGGLLGFGGQPYVSESTGSLRFRGRLNQSGKANIRVTLVDDGGTADGGYDTSATHEFRITINPTCDDGAGELFNPGQFDFSPVAGFLNEESGRADLSLSINEGNTLGAHSNIGNIPGLDNIGDIPLGGISLPNAPQSPDTPFGEVTPFTVTINNSSTTSGKNAMLSVILGDGQLFTKVDRRCAIDTKNAQASCYFYRIPSGETAVVFEAKVSNGDPVSAVGEISAENDSEFRDNTAQLRSAVNEENGEREEDANTTGGGGSFGWLNLLLLFVLRRRNGRNSESRGRES